MTGGGTARRGAPTTTTTSNSSSSTVITTSTPTATHRAAQTSIPSAKSQSAQVQQFELPHRDALNVPQCNLLLIGGRASAKSSFINGLTRFVFSSTAFFL
jgi:hypothetical protein